VCVASAAVISSVSLLASPSIHPPEKHAEIATTRCFTPASSGALRNSSGVSQGTVSGQCDAASL